MAKRGSYLGGSTTFHVGDPEWGTNSGNSKNIKLKKTIKMTPVEKLEPPTSLDPNSSDAKTRAAAQRLALNKSKEEPRKILKPIR